MLAIFFYFLVLRNSLFFCIMEKNSTWHALLFLSLSRQYYDGQAVLPTHAHTVQKKKKFSGRCLSLSSTWLSWYLLNDIWYEWCVVHAHYIFLFSSFFPLSYYYFSFAMQCNKVLKKKKSFRKIYNIFFCDSYACSHDDDNMHLCTCIIA